MADAKRSISRWSLATRSTVASVQTIPLVSVRRKLLRQNNSNQRTILQRDNRSKADIQELFKLYYSNDLQFDGFQRQIVTGKRIHTNLEKTNVLDDSSNNEFSAKIFVSREQINPCDVNKTDEQDRVEQSLKRDLLKVDHQLVHSSTSTNVPSRCKTASVHRIPRENSPISLSEDFCEPSFVKSVTFFDDPVPEPAETDEYQPRFEVFKRPLSSSKSSLNNTIPRPPHTSMFFHQPAKSTGMRTPVSRSTRGSTRSGMMTSTTLSPRYRSAARKRVESNQRIKSSTSRTTDSTAKQVTIISGPSITTPTPFTANEDDLFPTNEVSQRVVSIPSRCSRYVLVSFPEVPVRYNPPSYVERLLLQERFPKLFQNILRSYDHRSRSAPNHQSTSK